MFNYKHYVPILKAKEGEFKALQDTVDATKDLLTPLFEVVDVPWDYTTETEGKTLDEHLSKIGKKLIDAWGGVRRVFVDSNLVENNRLVADGSHHLIHLFNDFRAKGLQALPVTGLRRSADYKQAVRNIVNIDEKGICLRLTNVDLAGAGLKNQIDADLALFGLTASNVDLVIDLESIVGSNAELLVLTLSVFINNALPYLQDWKTLTFASSAFPRDLREIDVNTIDTINRLDWDIWKKLIALNPSRLPTFGDYSMAHPETLELDPRMITISASIRYTADDYWLIVRGRSIKLGGSGQFRNLCQNLILRPEYSGAAFSWGDNYINECAGGTVGTGNPTTWRKVGNNHHFQKVATQISAIP